MKTAEDDARAECVSGRRKRCIGLEEREDAARQRVADARATLVAAGAHATEGPAALASVLPFALPTWLELTAPVLLGYGLAPMPRNAPAQRQMQRPAQPLQPAPTQPVQRKSATRRKRTTQPKRGSAAYWLARLDRDRPDLATLVRNGHMSANMAAIRAGFRKSPVRLVASTVA